MATQSITVPAYVKSVAYRSDAAKPFPVVNGSSGDTIHSADGATLETVEAATSASWEAFQSWKKSSLMERHKFLNRMADLMHQRKDEIVKVQTDEISCDPDFSMRTVIGAIDVVRFTASCLLSIQGQVITNADEPDDGSSHMFVYKEPIGPVLIIPPWNAPVFLAARATAQVIAAGCSAVIKCSELSPRCQSMVVQAFNDASSIPGLVNSLQSTREEAAKITEALIASKPIRKVDFIGSSNVGRIVASLAGKHLKQVMLELGGKAPAIVLEDADLSRAAMLCCMSSIFHHGQICVSQERIIVVEAVADRFKAELVNAFKAMPQAHGQAVSKASAQHAYDVVQDAKEKGHAFLVGGPEFQSRTSVQPSVVTAPWGSRMEREETFGPSLSLYTVKDDKEAVDVANDSEYGFVAALHTRDMDRAMRLGKKLEYGFVVCNDVTFTAPKNAPHGGMKSSGIGRTNAMWGIENFLVNKTFLYRSAPPHS